MPGHRKLETRTNPAAAWPQADLVVRVNDVLWVDPRQLLRKTRVLAALQDAQNGLLAVNTLTNLPGLGEAGALSPSSGWLYGFAPIAEFLGVSEKTVQLWAQHSGSPIALFSSSSGSGARSIPAASIAKLVDYYAEMVDARYDARVRNAAKARYVR